jgi:hypothetical protein
VLVGVLDPVMERVDVVALDDLGGRIRKPRLKNANVWAASDRRRQNFGSAIVDKVILSFLPISHDRES